MIKASIICVINVHVSGPKNISPERFHVFELRQFLAGLGYDALTDFIANISCTRIELLVIRFFRPNVKALLLYSNLYRRCAVVRDHITWKNFSFSHDRKYILRFLCLLF